MVVFEIHVVDFVVLDTKGKPLVPRHMQAPCAFAAAGQYMRLPRRERTKFFHVLHVLQERKHLAEPVHGLRRKTFPDVFCVKPS